MMYQPCRNRTTGTTNYNLKDRGIYLLDFFALIHFFLINEKKNDYINFRVLNFLEV